MTQLDQLLRQLPERVEADDDAERRATAAARQLLRAAVASEATPTEPIVSRRHRGRLALACGLAATLAALMALIGSGTGSKPLGVEPASARLVLERAARAISSQAWHPLKPGERLYFRYLQSYPARNGPASPRPNGIEDVWVAGDGTARLVQHGFGPHGGQVLLFHATPGQRFAERRRQRAGARLPVMAYRQPYYWGAGTPVTYQQLLHVPTDPVGLRRWIERQVKPGGSAAARNGRVYSAVEALVSRSPLPPRLSAGLYRVIARLPEMRVIGQTRDPLGRPGVAVAFLGGLGAGHEELIFDPRRGEYLATRGVSPGGTIQYWQAIENQGVVRSDHQMPRAG
jgi:hypothetical protein